MPVTGGPVKLSRLAFPVWPPTLAVYGATSRRREFADFRALPLPPPSLWYNLRGPSSGVAGGDEFFRTP